MSAIPGDGARRVPRATYRLQLSEALPFARAASLVPYLVGLGISHLHLSPVLSARPGSPHFHDTADHRRVDPVLGGEDGLRQLADAAHDGGVGLIGEVVPHHMAIGPWNPLWDALLREGRSGDAAKAFDVDWETPLPGARDKVILPLLDGPYGEELAAGRLRLAETPGGIRVTYGDLSFPLSAETVEAVERAGAQRLEGKPDDPRSWGRMHSLLEQQHYRLVSTGAGRRLVNYRRFRSADGLAALRVEDDGVFDQTHDLLIRLVGEGVFDGLRISHVDGLADPAHYLSRLRDRVGPDAWLVVDTPTDDANPLPAGWPIDGTAGHELLRVALGVQLDPQGVQDLRVLADGVDGLPDARDRADAKAHQLDAHLGPDLRRLVRVAWDASQDEVGVRDVDYRTVLGAIGRILVALPVHRTHVDPATGEAGERDVAAITAAVAAARQVPSRRQIPDVIWRWLTDLLTGQVRWTTAAADAVTRFQQLSAPALALGSHDRLFLRHQALVAACEVGCDPDDPLVTPDQAHRAIAGMPPQGMRSTAGEDVVHGEDVRMRLGALTGLSTDWVGAADRILAGTNPPEDALGLRLLQVVTATWPIRDDGHIPLGVLLASAEARDRLLAEAVRIARGQDRITSHAAPNPDAEADLTAWLRGVLDPEGEVAAELRPLARRAADIGMAASLSQVLLRTTVPGVPDTWQGTERWDDCWGGDPQGTPADPAPAARTLEAWAADRPVVADLWPNRRDGAVKHWVLWRALQARVDRPQVFGPTGAFDPVAVTGRWADHVLAFSRTGADGGQAVVVCPRMLGRVTDRGCFDPVGRIWADTEVALPDAPGGGAWHDVLSERAVSAAPSIAASDLLADLPVALLVSTG